MAIYHCNECDEEQTHHTIEAIGTNPEVSATSLECRHCGHVMDDQELEAIFG